MTHQRKNIFSKLSLRTFLSGCKKFFGINEFFRHSQFLHLHIHLHLLFIFLFLSFSCNTNEPPPDNSSLTLAVEDASCIEAWLNLKAENISLPLAVTLKQTENNGEEKVRQVINLTTADTLLYVDSLLPKRNYNFKAEWINNSGKLKTAEATVVTMDTTSHNFTFETFSFGQHSSSVLYDVAIINENNIWAVGEIYMNDSLGNPDPKRFNAVRWNGSEWEVERIPYNYQGSPFYHPIQSIFAFNENDVWFCGNGIIHWNGNNYIPISIPTTVWGPYQMNKLWGSNSNDLYVVGNGGNIAHWDGSSWKKIESGTSLNINDIWGDYKLRTQEWEILAVAATYFTQPPTHILKLTKTEAKSISTSGIYTTSWGIWYNSEREYFIVGGGNYKRRSIMNSSFWLPMNELNQMYFCRAIRGTGFNDIVITGDFGTLYHYNGKSWKNYPDLIGSKTFLSVAKNENLLAAVGFKSAEALILFGRMD